MREDDSQEVLRRAFPLIDSVQDIKHSSKAKPPFVWAERPFRFDDLHRAGIRNETGSDPPGLGTIVVRVKRAVRVINAKYNKGKDVVSYAMTPSVQYIRYQRTMVTDQGVENTGITHLVMFGPEKTSNKLADGRKANKLVDTMAPIDRFTYLDDGGAILAEFVFQYRAIGKYHF